MMQTSAGPQLVTGYCSTFIRAYDPRTGKELWRLRAQFKDNVADTRLLPTRLLRS